MLTLCTDRVATLRIAVCGLDLLSAPQSDYYLLQAINNFFYVCRWYNPRRSIPPADCSVSALHAATLGSAVLTPECHSAGRILSLRTARLVSYWSNRSHQRTRSLAIGQGGPLISTHDYSLRNPRNAVSAGWLSRQPAPSSQPHPRPAASARMRCLSDLV